MQTSISLTSNDRNAAYGDPLVNHQCLADLISVYNRYAKDHGKAHHAAMLQVLTKISRIACGVFKEDNYVDLAAYAAIAYECEARSPAVGEADVRRGSSDQR